jgi:hypothetical protein
MSEEQTKRRIGAIVLVAILLLTGLVLGFDARQVKKGIRIHVLMERLGALREAAVVRVSGQVIGEVEGIRLVPVAKGSDKATPIVLDVWIDDEYAWLLHSNSEYFISQQALLSEAYLEVGAPRQAELGPVLQDGETALGVSPPDLDRFVQVSWDNLEIVTRVMREHRPEHVALMQALNELDQQLDALEVEPGAMARAWASGMRAKGEAILLYETLEHTGVSWDALGATTRSAQHLAARLRSERIALDGRISRLLDRIERLRDRVDPKHFRQLQEAGARIGGLVAKVQHILVGASTLAALVVRGEGTLGAFLQDTEIADEIKELTRMAKQRPWMTLGRPGHP